MLFPWPQQGRVLGLIPDRGPCYLGKLVWVPFVHLLPSPSVLLLQHPHRPNLLFGKVSGQVDRGEAQGSPPPLQGLEDRTQETL